MLTSSVSRQAYLAVNASDPMNEQHDLSRLRINVGDHLMDASADDALLQPCVRRGADQTALRSDASVASDAESAIGATLMAS
jgi:hypothetical protein